MRRLQDEYKTTFGMDQLERRLGYGNGGRQSEKGQEMESIILSSYAVGQLEIIADKNDARSVEIYGQGPLGNMAPKVFDSVRTFNDEITSRCIIIQMKPAPEGKPDKLTWDQDLWDGKFDEIRSLLLEIHYMDKWQLVEPVESARRREILLPFTTMQKEFNGTGDAVDYIRTTNKDHHDEIRATTLEHTILTAIGECMNPVNGWVNRVSASDIANKIPFIISSVAVGRRLATMGLENKVVKVGDKSVRCILVQDQKEVITGLSEIYDVHLPENIWEINGQQPPKPGLKLTLPEVKTREVLPDF